MSTSQGHQVRHSTSVTGVVAVSFIAALAWLVSDALNRAFSSGSYSSLGRVFPVAFPATLSAPPAPYPTLWAVVIPVLAGLLFAGITFLLLRLVLPGAASVPTIRQRRLGVFVVLWLVLILASHLTSTLSGLGYLVSGWMAGYSALMDLGIVLTRSTSWGVIWGWLPALAGTALLPRIGSRQRAKTRSVDARDNNGVGHHDGTGDHGSTAHATTGRKINLVSAGLVVATAAAVVTAYPLAEQAQVAANPAQPIEIPPAAEPSVFGSPPVSYAIDPNAQPDWCSQDVLLAPGFQDAATGHRSLTVMITNTGSVPCVLEGYPDVAFDDGGGNAMDVLMVRGGSFLTDDPGPTRTSLDPGASAEAYLGWNAVAGQSEASAGTILLAPYAGAQRQPAPLQLDVNNGQPVTMTAWTPAPTTN